MLSAFMFNKPMREMKMKWKFPRGVIGRRLHLFMSLIGLSEEITGLRRSTGVHSSRLIDTFNSIFRDDLRYFKLNSGSLERTKENFLWEIRIFSIRCLRSFSCEQTLIL